MITKNRLKELLRYDSDLGRFFWTSETGRGRKKSKNNEAGSFDAHGYGQVRIDGELYKEHRLVWLYVFGEWPNGQIDHINHDRRDNRVQNLRVVSNSENAKNRPLQRNNKSGHPGVWFDKKRGKFQAYINTEGKRLSLGFFSSIDGAINERKEAEAKYGFHTLAGQGAGRPKHKPLRFETYKEFQQYRSDMRKAMRKLGL